MALHRHAHQVLLHQQVEQLALLHVALVLQDRLSLHRRPGDAPQVAQLEAPRAVDEILQAALAEVEIGEERHDDPLCDDGFGGATRNE